MGNKRKNEKKMPKAKRKTRQELEKDNIQVMVKNEQLEARMDVKYLHKLEKKIRNLEVINETHKRNINQKNEEISELNDTLTKREIKVDRLEATNELLEKIHKKRKEAEKK